MQYRQKRKKGKNVKKITKMALVLKKYCVEKVCRHPVHVNTILLTKQSNQSG